MRTSSGMPQGAASRPMADSALEFDDRRYLWLWLPRRTHRATGYFDADGLGVALPVGALAGSSVMAASHSSASEVVM